MKQIDNNEYYAFREAGNREELTALLRLRYRIFRNSHLAPFVPENKNKLDLDRWDTRSRHFGLFQLKNGSSKPVGYLRVVEDGDKPVSPVINSIADEYQEFARIVTQNPAVTFPLMKYFPDSHKIQEIHNNLRNRNERLVETGRFALGSESRFRQLGKHMIESAIAVYFFAKRIENAMGCCNLSQNRFYGRYGFYQLKNGKNTDFAGIGKKSCCVIGSINTVPLKVRPRLTQMAEAYQQTGMICYHPNCPDDFSKPMEPAIYDQRLATAVA